MANSTIQSHIFSLLQKRSLKTSSSTSTLFPNSSSSTSSIVQYLINSCGLTSKSALSVSKKFQTDRVNPQRSQSVVEFLKAHDFNDTQIGKLIISWPQVLQCRVEDNLRPKMEFLITNGFAGKLLPELVVSNPTVLKSSLNSHLKPSVEYLKSFLYSDKNLVAAVKRASWLLTVDLKRVVEPNVDFLVKEGVPLDCITNFILKNPRAAMQKHDMMVEAVNAVKNLGIEPKVRMFIHVVRVMISMSESTWKKKMELFRSIGCSEDEIINILKRYPLCLASSEEKIRHAMDFYVNTMKLPPRAVLSYPKFLMFAIEKRVLPRYNVLKILESKKLVKGGKKFQWLLTISDEIFFENYVKKHLDQVPGLLEIYRVPKRQKS